MKRHIIWILADLFGLGGKIYVGGTTGWLFAGPVMAALSIAFILLSVVHMVDHAYQLALRQTEPPADPSKLMQDSIEETERRRKEELETLSPNGIRLADAA